MHEPVPIIKVKAANYAYQFPGVLHTLMHDQTSKDLLATADIQESRVMLLYTQRIKDDEDVTVEQKISGKV